MRRIKLYIDPLNPQAIDLLGKLSADLQEIGLDVNRKGVIEYDETDRILAEKLKNVLTKYP